MVLGIRSGYRCETELKEPLNDADLQEASSRIDKAAFVGILEHYGICICLFHAMFGGQLPVRKEELVVTRTHRSGGLSASQLRTVDKIDNKFDESLYNRAVARLKQDVQKHMPLVIELCQEAWPEIPNHVASFLEMSSEDINANGLQANTTGNLSDGALALPSLLNLKDPASKTD